MNTEILTPEIQEFIATNLKLDTVSFLLKKNIFNSVSNKDLVEQLEAKNKCKKKIPTWFYAKNIYYPNKLNIEQTSSEITAKYKSSLVSGNTLIDITGGFGVDSFYFSKQFNNVIHCDVNTELSQIVQHNLEQLGAKNITCFAENGIDYLKRMNETVDCIYIDPSRRDSQKNRVFFLKDCEPNIPESLELFFNYTNTIISKTSPFLDISSGINDLKHVKAIHCIAVNNDVKELLWVLEKEYLGDITIQTINSKNTKTEEFSFCLSEEEKTEASFSEPLSYLYEPNAAIMKSGGFTTLTAKLNISKLHPNSHLYTSDLLIDFPGRIFKIENILPFNKKQLKKIAPKKANVTTRNFPNTVAQLRKLFNIKDGGTTYLFFTTTNKNEKIVLVCKKQTEDPTH